MKNTIQGFISIFLALIILPVYSFAILTVDSVKIATAKSHLRMATETTVYDSVLGSFDRKLYEKYNLYGLPSHEDEILDYSITYTMKIFPIITVIFIG